MLKSMQWPLWTLILWMLTIWSVGLFFSPVSMAADTSLQPTAIQQASPQAATRPAPTADLIDIELPTKPGINWWWWLEKALLMLAIVLVLVLMYWLRNRLWRRFHLRWRLKRLQRTLLKSQNAESSRSQAFAIYQIFDEVKRHQLMLDSAIQTLAEQLDPICFSRHRVSHETLKTTLQSFQSALLQAEKQALKALPGQFWQKAVLLGQWMVAKWQQKTQKLTVKQGSPHVE